MGRYVVMRGGKSAGHPRMVWWEDQNAPPLPYPMSYVADPQPTGIKDQHGNDIFKVPNPVGFLVGRDVL